MRRGFTIIESLCMLVAIFMVAWIMTAVLKKNGEWPFSQKISNVKSEPKHLIQATKAETAKKPVEAGER